MSIIAMNERSFISIKQSTTESVYGRILKADLLNSIKVELE